MASFSLFQDLSSTLKSPVPGVSEPLLELLSPPISYPVLWEDWPAKTTRRRWLKLLRTETVLLNMGPVQTEKGSESAQQSVLTRAQRAHWRLSWSQRAFTQR